MTPGSPSPCTAQITELSKEVFRLKEALNAVPESKGVMQTPPETAAMQSRIRALEEKLAVGIRVPGGFPGPHPETKAACSLSGDGAAAQQGGQAVPEPPALRSASELGHGSGDNAIGDYCTMRAPVPGVAARDPQSANSLSS